jgi:magnesium-transporting ATPase (P-type)
MNALLFVVVGSILLKESPLQAIQLLWVNMIMDSLASLALATEQPKPELLLRMPLKKTDFIVTRKMGKHIIWMSIFQMTVLFIFLFAGEYIIPESNEDLRFNEQRRLLGYTDWETNDKVFPGRQYTVNGDKLYLTLVGGLVGDDDSRHLTFIFNLFIWLQIINMIASRKIHDEINICKYFWGNPSFLIIWFIIVVLNFLIIQFTGKFFSLHPTG